MIPGNADRRHRRLRNDNRRRRDRAAHQRDEHDGQGATASIITAGQQLLNAKEKIERGKWLTLFRDCDDDRRAAIAYRFSSRTANRLMVIAENRVLSDPTHVSVLPPHWGTLYLLALIDEQDLEKLIADGKIHPDITREQVEDLIRSSSKTPTTMRTGTTTMRTRR